MVQHSTAHNTFTIQSVIFAYICFVGGITVSVFGSFTQTNTIQCSFGTITVSAVYVNSSFIECVAPSHNAGPVYVEVSVDGYYFSVSRIQFTYIGMLTQHNKKTMRVFVLVPSHNAGPVYVEVSVVLFSVSMIQFTYIGMLTQQHNTTHITKQHSTTHVFPIGPN